MTFLLTAIAKETDRASESLSTAFNLCQLRILGVDDEADMRELLMTILEQYGAKVRVAASAAEALIVPEQFQPDVLISDMLHANASGETVTATTGRTYSSDRANRLCGRIEQTAGT